MARTETVSIYLLNTSVTGAADALRSGGDGLPAHRLVAPAGPGTLFVQKNDDSEPDWVRLLRPRTAPPVDYRSSSVSAVLLLQASQRWFAVTFGHGRFLLEPAAYERDFGLRCAVNGLDPARLRGLEARTFNEYALHSARQLSRTSSIESLEVDQQRDLLRSMSGDLADPALGKRMDGRDAARLTAELDAADLASKCSELLRISQLSTYKQFFPWIDTIAEVRDPAEIAALEQAAYSNLGQRRWAGFDLFPPELVGAEIVTYRLVPGNWTVIEPDQTLLRHPLSAPQSSRQARASVQRYTLRGYDSDGNVAAEWNLADCLHWESRDAQGRVVVLDGGRWYRINNAFATEVLTFAAGLRPSGLSLPDARMGEREEKYNERAAAGSRDFALLDKQLVRLPGQSGIEPCDLFAADRQFIHVKHRKNGSAPMSHLFGQALVSAESFVSEPQFQHDLQTLLENASAGFGNLIATPVVARDYSVVFALITKGGGGGSVATQLPFFSKVYLRAVVKRLQGMGYSVYVDEISTPLAGPSGQPPAPAKRRRRRPTAKPHAPTPTKQSP